jgi:uncharacterized damage-inducible protein DinB
MNPNAYFIVLARHNVWATDRLLEAVAEVSEDDYRRDAGLFFRSIHGTLAHLYVVEAQLWFRRFAEGISPVVALDADLLPERQALATQLLQGTRRWEPLVASLPPERFDGRMNYTAMRGQPASLPFAATLGHVFNHGTHHRGQITAALTALGRPCPELDMVYFLQTQPPQEPPA